MVGLDRTISDDERELAMLQEQFDAAQAELDEAMNTSRQKLDHLLHKTDSQSQVDSEKEHLASLSVRSGFDSANCARELIESQLIQQLSFIEDEHIVDNDFMIPTELQGVSMNSVGPTQSELYKQWIAKRGFSNIKKTESQPNRSARSTFNHSLLQAQESMKRFQETLASIAPRR